MKALKILGLALIGLIVVFAAIGLMLPSQWKVERSIVVNAPAAKIFPLISDFKRGWPQWSDFDREDSTISYTFSGPEQGTGATRSWTSQKMGNGSQWIVSADPQSGIFFELEINGDQFKLYGRITMEPEGPGTRVTWIDRGDVGLHIPKRYLVFMMDKMLGKTFESSLNKLKEIAEQKK